GVGYFGVLTIFFAAWTAELAPFFDQLNKVLCSFGRTHGGHCRPELPSSWITCMAKAELHTAGIKRQIADQPAFHRRCAILVAFAKASEGRTGFRTFSAIAKQHLA
ncbi:hypothetical protein J4729_24440, partial [Leisingera sp. HS039]|uniref:hypothetical protein n=1 Tax=Leisingera sp. HS039 TaxID=2818496 RepID=UPI001B3A2C05